MRSFVVWSLWDENFVDFLSVAIWGVVWGMMSSDFCCVAMPPSNISVCSQVGGFYVV